MTPIAPPIGSSLRTPVECRVWVGDNELVALYPFLKAITVDMRRDAATTCALVFETSQSEHGAWTIQDAGEDDRETLLVPWRTLVIMAVFGSREQEVMRGFIKDVTVACPEEMSAATVTVSGQDETLLLDREHIRTTWSTEEDSVTDGEIARRIATDHQLGATVETGLDNVTLVSDDTYVTFLRDRAEANGFEMYVRDSTLYFAPPDLEGEPQPPIRVYAGRASNCLRLSVSYDGHRPDQVALTRAPDEGTDSETETFNSNLVVLGRQAASSENKGLRAFSWQLNRATGSTLVEAKSRAQAKANENAWKIVAEGELDGALYGHVLLPFKTVTVDGIGHTYDGTYYVDRVAHRFAVEGYRQEFRLLRNGIGDASYKTSVDPLAGVR